MLPGLTFEDLGRIGYAAAYARQERALAEALESRDSAAPSLGRIFLLEHDPVITISNRPTASSNLIAREDTLAAAGVAIARTDRGGDITYHGPGQLVVYPVLDLNRLNLGLHDYMRMLESIVIAVCAAFGITADRDAAATGVWVRPDSPGQAAKIAAMGVRIRRWVSMHGLALNVSTNLDHFGFIVPCGLTGRTVTSMRAMLADRCPSMDEVKAAMRQEFERHLADSTRKADSARAGHLAASP